jgi:uncharacterized protein (TIGR02452 family)
MTSASPNGLNPPQPNDKESNINNLFEYVKHIATESDYNFDNYMITIGTHEPIRYTTIMNNILSTIKSATENKHVPISLQRSLTELNTYIPDTFNQGNIQLWNDSKHFTRLTILNFFIPKVYAFLLLFINQNLLNNTNNLIKQKYEYKSRVTDPPQDHNLRFYYDTAKNIIRYIRPHDKLQDFTNEFVQIMADEENAQKKGEDDIADKVTERTLAVRMNSSYRGRSIGDLYQILTPLTTSFNDSTGNKVTMTFYIQNFGGDGDCLFLTLLAILKVFRPEYLAATLNNYQQDHADIFPQPYTNNVANRKYDAGILRHVIVNYILDNLNAHVYPEVEMNQQHGLSASTSVDMYGGTYRNRLTLPAGTKKGDLSPNGGASPATGIILFLNGLVTTNNGSIISIDPNITYQDQMKLWNTWGTEVELAAATQLFNINIININSNGHEQRFLTKLDHGFDAYIFHEGVNHYMNIWPNTTGNNDPIWAVNYTPALIAIYPETQAAPSPSPSPSFTAAAAAGIAAAAAAAASHPHPPPPLNTPDGVIDQIRKRIGEISTAGMAAGVGSLRAPPARKIAILVNGGSFNPIHNGHLEMYTLARNELMKTHGFHDVLVIYVVSPYAELKDKIKNQLLPATTSDESIAQNIFDAPGKLDRIKICREAFASIDNVSNGNELTADGQHLSQNMFVWPKEDRNAFSIHKQITGPTNVRFYGLSGSDYSNNGYFLYGIDGYSIIVGRSNTATPDFSNYQHGATLIDTSKTGIFIKTASEIASSAIRPAIFALRDSLRRINANTDNPTIIQMVTNLTNPHPAPIPGSPSQANLLRDVPNSILFRLLTYNEDPSVQMRRGEYGTAKEGYRRFRAWLFRQKLSEFGSTPSSVQQNPHNVGDITALYKLPQIAAIIAKNGPIDEHNIHFLQMTSAHALYTQGVRHTPSLLNFANANNPGGGVLNGSTVQEETLCMMAPELYRSLLNLSGHAANPTYKNWGEDNWYSKFYYSSKNILIPFTTTDEFTFDTTNKPFSVTPYMGRVISAATIEWDRKDKSSGITKNPFNQTHIDKIQFPEKMRTIIKNIIAVAAIEQECDVLILGAWGCGAFAPKDAKAKEKYIKYVATLFCQALYSTVDGDIKLKDLFKKVIFPIPDCNTYDLFKQGFDEEEARILHPPPAPAHTPSLSPAAASSPAAPAAPAAASSPAAPAAPAAPEPTPPYVTLTNIIAGIDTSIDNFVEQLSQRNPLKEISVNETEGKSSASAASAASKFTRVDGNFPKLTVPLYEQMVYHRAGSMNLNPLAMFIPTGYKINFQEINEYFKEMARRNDPETQELMNMVIAAYGNNNNSLFYRHTLPGKVTAVGGPRPVMVGGALSFPTTMTTTTAKGVFDLDEKTAKLIQFKIDKWHRSYIDWCFYRNATRFFVENQQLPKDELVTLKMEFDEVFDAKSGGKGLMSMVVNINKDYENIKKHYETNVEKNVGQNSTDFQSFIYLFDILYAEIQKYKDDSLDYVTERKKYFPSYSFDVNSRSLLLQVVDKFRSIFLQLKLLEDATTHKSNKFIKTVPFLSQLETLQSIADEFMRLRQSIETNPALKTAVDIFEKYMLTSNGFLDVNRQTKYIPSYKIIQYVFQTIGYYNDEPRTTSPSPAGLFEGYVGKLYTVGSATKPKDPKEIFVKPIDDEFIEKLFNENDITPQNSYRRVEMDKLKTSIKSHLELIDKLKRRKELNRDKDEPEASIQQSVLSSISKKRSVNVSSPPPPPPIKFGDETKAGQLTTQIKNLNIELKAYDEPPEKDAYRFNGSLEYIIKQVEAKIKLLKGKYFVSSLLFYNRHLITTTPPSPPPGPTPITTAAANFFQKFYTESKLETPELDSFPQKNEVSSFSFGIDLIFLLLFRISKYYFASFHATFVEKLKEQIGPQNVGLRALRENVQYKESKLNHVCEIVAKLLGIPVVRIIPDRSSYLIKADNDVFKGFVSVDTTSGYSKKWEENIDGSGKYSAKIKYVTNEMTKGLDKALGLTDPGAASASEENLKKMKAALVVLLEHNTVQVVHMLFAKPRDIWYSPDMRTGTLTSVSKWAFFRLEKPEIIAKSTFKLLNSRWDAGVGTTPLPKTPRLDYILDKTPTASPDDFKIEIVNETVFKSNSLPSSDNPLCVFIIATQPSPTMLAPGKDSANESRFQNSSFSVGGIEPSINDNHAVGSKLFQKLKEAIRPDPEKCSNVRGLIQEQASELSSMTTDLLKAAGVDTSIKIAGVKNQIAMAALTRAMKLIVVQVNPGPTYDISKSPPQPNVKEALSIANNYKNDPDFDAIRGFCMFINKRREEIAASTTETDEYEGIDIILDSLKKKRSSPSIITIVVLVLLIIKDDSKYIQKISSGAQTGGGRLQIYVGGANTDESNALVVKLLTEAAATSDVVAKFVLARTNFYNASIGLGEADPLKMIKDAADQGYASAEYLYANMLENQKQQSEETKRAPEYYKRAAARGHIDAVYKSLTLQTTDDDKKALPENDSHKYLKFVSVDPTKSPIDYDYTEGVRNAARDKLNTRLENIGLLEAAKYAAESLLNTSFTMDNDNADGDDGDDGGGGGGGDDGGGGGGGAVAAAVAAAVAGGGGGGGVGGVGVGGVGVGSVGVVGGVGGVGVGSVAAAAAAAAVAAAGGGGGGGGSGVAAAGDDDPEYAEWFESLNKPFMPSSGNWTTQPHAPMPVTTPAIERALSPFAAMERAQTRPPDVGDDDAAAGIGVPPDNTGGVLGAREWIDDDDVKVVDVDVDEVEEAEKGEEEGMDWDDNPKVAAAAAAVAASAAAPKGYETGDDDDDDDYENDEAASASQASQAASEAASPQIWDVPVPDLKSPKQILEEERLAQQQRQSELQTGTSHPLPSNTEESGLLAAFKDAEGIGPSQVGIAFAGNKGSSVIEQRVPILERVQPRNVGAMPVVPKPKRELTEAEQRAADALAAIEAEEIAANERLRAKKAERAANLGSSGSPKPAVSPPPAVRPPPPSSSLLRRPSVAHQPTAAPKQSGAPTGSRISILERMDNARNVSSPPSAKPDADGGASGTADIHAQALAAIEREEIAENERLMVRRAASIAAARAPVGTSPTTPVAAVSRKLPVIPPATSTSPTISKGNQLGATSAKERTAAEVRFAALPQAVRAAMSKNSSPPASSATLSASPPPALVSPPAPQAAEVLAPVPPPGKPPQTRRLIQTSHTTTPGHVHLLIMPTLDENDKKKYEKQELEEAAVVDPKSAVWVGGRSYSSHGADTSRKMKPQIGGADEYELPPGSHLYNKLVTSFYPISSVEFKTKNPKFDQQVEAGIIDGTIPPLTKREENEEQPPEDEEPSDNLTPAEQSANNPEVIKNLIRSLNVPSKAKTIERYEQLVKMCDKTTALELIKQLLLSKSIHGKKPIDERMPTDERILEILGWNKNTNKLLYRNNGQGLFSLFCFDSGSFSQAFSSHCGENYVCMLNWVLILAFRLRIRDPATYTDVLIEELINNMHNALYGFVTPVSMADNFTRLDADPKFYTDMSKKIMIGKVMFDSTLKPLRRGIKAQVREIPVTKNPKTPTLDPEVQNNTLRNNNTRRTVKIGGLRANSKNSTRKLHRHDRVRPMSHTIKITHKSNSNSKKTVSKRNNQFALRM